VANRNVEVLPSAARTTAQAVITLQASDDKAVALIFTVDTTVDPAAASITPSIDFFDPISQSWTTILTGAAIAATGRVRLRIGEGLTAAANLTVNDVIARKFRFNMAVADTDSITYSVGVEIVNR